jgi:hypothetical protein
LVQEIGDGLGERAVGESPGPVEAPTPQHSHAVAPRRGGDRARNARLADAGLAADHRDAAGRAGRDPAEAATEALDLVGAADQRCRLGLPARGVRFQRGEGGAELRVRELMDALGLTEIAEPMQSQVDERRVWCDVLAHCGNGGGGHEHLTPVTDRVQPCAAVERRTEVRALPRERGTDVDAHPHRQPVDACPLDLLQRELDGQRGGDGVGGSSHRGEAGDERVTSSGEHLAAELGDAGAKDGVVLREGRVHRVRRALPSTRRTLHIGEEKGDRFGRRRRRRRCELRRSGRDRTRRLGCVERVLLREDLPLEPHQRRARVEAELFSQVRLQPLEGAQRVRLPAASVERQHELPPEALAQRVLRDQVLELGDERTVVPEREVGLDAIFDGPHPKLVEAHRLACKECDVRELCERRSPP